MFIVKNYRGRPAIMNTFWSVLPLRIPQEGSLNRFVRRFVLSKPFSSVKMNCRLHFWIAMWRFQRERNFKKTTRNNWPSRQMDYYKVEDKILVPSFTMVVALRNNNNNFFLVYLVGKRLFRRTVVFDAIALSFTGCLVLSQHSINEKGRLWCYYEVHLQA